MASLLIVASAVPTLDNFINPISSLLNFYRLVVVFLAILTLIIFRGEVRLSGRRSFNHWMGFLLVWVLYGVILLIAAPYAEPDRGSRELFSILCGAFCFYILSNLHLTKDEIETVLRVLFFVLVALIVMGFVEIITGQHLPSSMFNDPDNEVKNRVSINSATGFMYNINDFSSLITLMLPVAIGRFRIKFYRVQLDPGWILVVCVWIINRINDANICIISIIIGVLLYFIIYSWRDRRGVALVFAGIALFFLILFLVYYFEFTKKADLISRTVDLVEKSEEGVGSVYSRSMLYKNGLNAGWISGFLGLGPGGFPAYYSVNQSDTLLINPHSLLMEILSQYGLIILALFLFLLITLFRRSFRLYQYSSDHDIREWGRTGAILIVTYVISSFASSSYLPFSFHWTLLALICLMTEIGHETEAAKHAEEDTEKKMIGKRELQYEGMSSD